SSLLNALTDAGALVEDRLFATLDPKVRRLELPGGRAVLVADTVGFVRRLPHGLVEAFRSTLSEAAEADLLIHMVDGTDADPDGQMAAVREVLEEIGADQVPELLVINKTDAMSGTDLERLTNLHPEAVFISALEGSGLDALLERVATEISTRMVTMSLSVPYDRGDIVAAAHRVGDVIEEKHDEVGTVLDVRVPLSARDRFVEFAR
ncbi:MAG TPA: GTPase HflX, partial [Acidimicrobiia bacterium]|nr:GTPase HflX [Acidimicrobiia bacterium]